MCGVCFSGSRAGQEQRVIAFLRIRWVVDEQAVKSRSGDGKIHLQGGNDTGRDVLPRLGRLWLGGAAVDHPVASGDAAITLKMYSSIRFVAAKRNLCKNTPP